MSPETGPFDAQPSPIPARSRAAGAVPARARDDGLQTAHFAFVRARVQGVSLRDAWLRYLQPPGETQPPDLATLQATLQRIRDAFAAAARRERRHGLARLVLVDLERVPAEPARPSLEAFAAERGLEDFSEAEQLEAYEAVYGRAGPRPGRRARLVARQLEALRWLESLGTRAPRPDDPVDAWLPPAIAARLAAAGWSTVRTLIEQVNGRHGRWWRPLRGIGPAKARRVEAWLQSQAAALGSVVAPRHAATVTHGAGSASEHAAVDAWLATRPQASVHTRRAYRREAERFQLWLRATRGRPLAEAGADDAAAYLGFLADPQPRADWCAARHHPRGSPLWRPFEGPLSPSARRQTVTILRNLFAFLQARGLAAGNPWHGAAAGCVRRPPIDATRHLGRAEREAVERRLAALPDSAATWRLRLAWALVDATGLRLSELLQLRGADWQGAPEGQGGPLLRVGSSGRERWLVLPAHIAPLLARSLQARSLPADPGDASLREACLIGQAAEWPHAARGLAAGRVFDPRAGIAPATLYASFKALFRQAARDLAGRGDEAQAAALRRASGHWLRHTHGIERIGGGQALHTLQQRLGHASPSTTRLYLRSAGQLGPAAPGPT